LYRTLLRGIEVEKGSEGGKKKRRGRKRKTSKRQLRIDVYRLDVGYDCRVCRIRYGDRNEALHNHESNYHELLQI